MTDAPLPSSFDSDPDFYDERKFRKFFRRLKDEPLVPLGVGLTCWALYNASKSIRTGNSIRTNRYFRYRLYAQGFTIVAMIGGSFYYKADRLKRREYVKLKDEQKAQEKREKWIKELEARDAEDKEWREKLGKVQKLQREEAEDRRLLEEARKKRLAANEDEQQVKENLKKEQKSRKAAKELRQDQKAESVEQAPKKPATPKYESVLGEREEGGFLGHKWVTGFYEHRLKPMYKDLLGSKDEKSDESAGKTDKK